MVDIMALESIKAKHFSHLQRLPIHLLSLLAEIKDLDCDTVHHHYCHHYVFLIYYEVLLEMGHWGGDTLGTPGLLQF